MTVEREDDGCVAVAAAAAAVVSIRDMFEGPGNAGSRAGRPCVRTNGAVPTSGNG